MNRNSIRLILRAVPLGIGVSTLVLVTLGSIEVSSPITFLSIGIICLAILQFKEK